MSRTVMLAIAASLVLAAVAAATLWPDADPVQGLPESPAVNRVSRAEFIAEANEICVNMSVEVEGLSEVLDQAEDREALSAFARQSADIYQRAAVQLRRLETPPDDATLIDEWLDAFDEVAPLQQEEAVALIADDTLALDPLVADFTAALTRARTKGGVLGLSCP